jgi:hypothetical protein
MGVNGFSHFFSTIFSEPDAAFFTKTAPLLISKLALRPQNHRSGGRSPRLRLADSEKPDGV